jgi:cadmium resistance protein CadD (predicted permease)
VPPLVIIGAAIGLFTVTNVDDLLLLAAFFADPHVSARTIVAGQFLGIGTLVAISAAAALASVVIPPAWIGLLGLFPLLLGVRTLWQLRHAVGNDDEAMSALEGEHAPERRTHAHTLGVASVTIANGGDNLGVYIPVFAADVHAIPIYVVVFAVMTAFWCLAGHALVNNRLVGYHLRRYGHLLLPFVLIAIGLLILRDSLSLLR